MLNPAYACFYGWKGYSRVLEVEMSDLGQVDIRWTLFVHHFYRLMDGVCSP
jgi:hypothetical protein